MRKAYVDFIDRHDAAWELGMAALAVVYVVVGFAVESVSEPVRPALELLEKALTVIFVLEFGTRIAASDDRAAYLRGHWIDAVALLPAARGARLLRLLRLVRALAGVYRGMTHLERIARHRGLAVVFVGWIGVMLLTAAGLYIAEHGVNGAVNSPFDALWWGVSTMTTVGYGDVYPLTTEGRIAAMALMILGIGLFSVVTATITSYLTAQRESPQPEDVSHALGRLAQLFHAGDLNEGEFARAKARLLLNAGSDVSR